MQESTECFMCMFINRRLCTSPDSNKTLDNIFAYLIVFVYAVTPHTELSYFGLDMMCTLKFSHLNPSEATMFDSKLACKIYWEMR